MVHARLTRELGVPGAVVLGLGSMVGTGVFVGIAIATGVGGPWVVVAIVIAALLALCNGMSSAQLAASHPVAGGTYEYGYRYLHPLAGFSAGWLFLTAKSASAATAALGCAGYLLLAADGAPRWTVPLALGLVVVVTAVVLAGVRRTTAANAVIVAITVLGLGLFAALAFSRFQADRFASVPGSDASSGAGVGLLHAAALMFVAYTGYGRIATMGEEVHDPARTIPRAMLATVAVTMVLYLAVAVSAIGAVGSTDFAATTEGRAAPLAVVAERLSGGWAGAVLTLAAIIAMLGVLLNLVLGLSRVVLAMARRGDAPGLFAGLDHTQRTPTAAVLLVMVVVGGLALLGDVYLTWSFSAFTVLVYYALTNLAALRLPREHRRWPRWIAVLGFLGCLGLTPWLDPLALLMGGDLLAVGWLWFAACCLLRSRRGDEEA